MISIKRWSASNVTWWVQLEDLGHPQNWSNVKLNWIKLFMILQRLLMMVIMILFVQQIVNMLWQNKRPSSPVITTNVFLSNAIAQGSCMRNMNSRFYDIMIYDMKSGFQREKKVIIKWQEIMSQNQIYIGKYFRSDGHISAKISLQLSSSLYISDI